MIRIYILNVFIIYIHANFYFLVHYNAYFELNDEPFDSTYLRNKSFEFKVRIFNRYFF